MKISLSICMDFTAVFVFFFVVRHSSEKKNDDNFFMSLKISRHSIVFFSSSSSSFKFINFGVKTTITFKNATKRLLHDFIILLLQQSSQTSISEPKETENRKKSFSCIFSCPLIGAGKIFIL